MFTIASLARETGLPRRVVQYAVDKGLLLPIPGTDSDTSRMLFASAERDMLHMLHAPSLTSMSYAALKLLFSAVRSTLVPSEGDAGWSDNGVRAAFANSRAGKPAWLAFAFYRDTAQELCAQVQGVTRPQEMVAVFRRFGDGAWIDLTATGMAVSAQHAGEA
jgi:hypothetical protein